VARLTMAGIVLLSPALLIPAADLAADHRMYLSLAAFAGAVAMLPWSRATKWMFVLALALLGVRQTILWSSEETLWRWSVARSPNTLRPKLELSRRVKPAECLAILRTAEIRWPDDARIADAIADCEARATAK
jgi:hypothetical protein